MPPGWTSYLTHLECTVCRAEFDADQLYTVCSNCGKVLFARYDLARVKQAITPDAFKGRDWTLWRYRELLPVRDPGNVVTLGEGMTPIIAIRPQVAAQLGFSTGRLRIKEEGLNPTGSFKARGMAVAISRAKELGVTDIALPSAGNAGAAAAAYAAAAGMTAHIAVPRDVPPINLTEMQVSGADVILVDGLIDEAGRVIHELAQNPPPARGARAGRGVWFEVATLKEPYRQEGKKTLGIELAEQGGWGEHCLPDVLIFPTGGGTGVVGMAKAFDELEALGWIGSARPKIVVVQAEGCAPLVRAVEQGAEHAVPWTSASTIAAGIRVPSASGDYLVLRAVRDTGGTAIAVSDDQIRAAQAEMASGTGVYSGPEGAATWAALQQLRRNGFLDGTEDVLLFSTSAGVLYPS